MIDLYIMSHVIGVFIGFGGAIISDIFFLFSTKDRVLDNRELKRLKASGLIVWIGLIIITISGLLIFLTDPEYYLYSEKFITKMLIVFILIINGLIFHTKHLKMLEKVVGENMRTSERFRRNSTFLYVSGAISIVSWISATYLGYARSIDVSVISAMMYYISAVIVVTIIAQILKSRLLQ